MPELFPMSPEERGVPHWIPWGGVRLRRGVTNQCAKSIGSPMPLLPIHAPFLFRPLFLRQPAVMNRWVCISGEHLEYREGVVYRQSRIAGVRSMECTLLQRKSWPWVSWIRISVYLQPTDSENDRAPQTTLWNTSFCVNFEVVVGKKRYLRRFSKAPNEFPGFSFKYQW